MIKQLGMSLIEILAVIILILIIGILLAPSYVSYVTDNRLISAAEALNEQVKLARLTAIERNQSVTLSFTTGSNWCFGISTGTSLCNCTPPSTACNLSSASSTQFPDVSTLSIASGFAAYKTTFSPARGSVDVVGKATLTNRVGKTINISVNKLGLPRLCSTDVGGYASSC